MTYINLDASNIMQEHICCAIGDPKHAQGVLQKKQWLMERMNEGHVFRKLDARGKVFIEYAPLKQAWVVVGGERYMYIYCLWVAGSFKGQGHGKALLTYCIDDAKQQGMAGVCVISSKKKKPYLSDKKFLTAHGFVVVDQIDEEYELLALSFDGSKPYFLPQAKQMSIQEKELTIYYSMQCPFILQGIQQVKAYCEKEQIPLRVMVVDTLDKAKHTPCVFNNYAIFYQGRFQGVQLLNENVLKKLFARCA